MLIWESLIYDWQNLTVGKEIVIVIVIRKEIGNKLAM